MRAQNSDSNAETRDSKLRALSRVSAALSGLWDLDAILSVALDNVLKITDGTCGGILLLDEETQTLSYRIYQGLNAEYVEGMHLRLGEGIAGRVAESGKSILLGDVTTEQPITPDLPSNEGLKTFVSVPLRVKEKVLGVINIASHVPRLFGESDMHVLHSIGDQLGVAIEQARLHERLRKARERYRRLVRQTLVAQEEERRRIARELHDETSQSLSGLTLQLQALLDQAEMSGKLDEDFMASLKKVQSLAIEVHREVSRLIADLRPSLLDTLGLVPAIRQYAEVSLHPLDINVSVEIKGTGRRLPPDVETELFRVVQGLIGNVAQHSKARNASIILEYSKDELFLRVIDDGQGFDVSKVTDIEDSGRGRGVFSMRERIGLLGGTASIESQLGLGTTAWARVPIGEGIEDAENKSIGSG